MRAEGKRGLTLTRLARRLGVTTGSFYWHFENREAFLRVLLDTWSRVYLAPAAARARGSSGDGSEQLLELGRATAAHELPKLDAAMREWALDDARVAEAVARADRTRIRWLSGFFEAAGVAPAEARRRGEIAMWCWIGGAALQSDPSVESRARKFGRLLQKLAVP